MVPPALQFYSHYKLSMRYVIINHAINLMLGGGSAGANLMCTFKLSIHLNYPWATFRLITVVK